MSSVVFIGSPGRYKKQAPWYKCLFMVSPYALLGRIIRSFVPPYNQNYRKVYVDLLGPLIGYIILTVVVNYGFSLKPFHISVTPLESIFIYSIFMPLFSFSLTKLGQSSITFLETTSIVGYAVYGHLVTLIVSFICYQEKSNSFFFVCLIIFGGLSTVRMALVFLGTIPLPAVRLLVCTTISVVNILHLVFLHFAYMHRSFVHKIAE